MSEFIDPFKGITSRFEGKASITDPEKKKLESEIGAIYVSDISEHYKKLLKKYHPDKESDKILKDVKNIILKRIIELKSNPSQTSNNSRQRASSTQGPFNRTYDSGESMDDIFEDLFRDHPFDDPFFKKKDTKKPKQKEGKRKPFFRDFFNSGKSTSSKPKNKEAAKLKVKELLSEIEDSSLKSVFDRCMKEIINIENNFSVNLSKTKDKGIFFRTEKLLSEIENSSLKSTFDRCMKEIVNIENNFFVNLSKIKDKGIFFRTEKLLSEIEDSNLKSTFDRCMKEIINIENNFFVNLSKIKDEMNKHKKT